MSDIIEEQEEKPERFSEAEQRKILKYLRVFDNPDGRGSADGYPLNPKIPGEIENP